MTDTTERTNAKTAAKPSGLKSSLADAAGTIVFGMEDGTVSIFGLIFGVAVTTNDGVAILVAGTSGAVAAAVSMMAGAYLDTETSQA
jgi:vacuolar iron transporter family protein